MKDNKIFLRISGVFFLLIAILEFIRPIVYRGAITADVYGIRTVIAVLTWFCIGVFLILNKPTNIWMFICCIPYTIFLLYYEIYTAFWLDYNSPIEWIVIAIDYMHFVLIPLACLLLKKQKVYVARTLISIAVIIKALWTISTIMAFTTIRYMQYEYIIDAVFCIISLIGCLFLLIYMFLYKSNNGEGKIKKREKIQLGTADKLLQLKELMDQGIITKEEFEAKKVQLLNK